MCRQRVVVSYQTTKVASRADSCIVKKHHDDNKRIISEWAESSPPWRPLRAGLKRISSMLQLQESRPRTFWLPWVPRVLDIDNYGIPLCIAFHHRTRKQSSRQVAVAKRRICGDKSVYRCRNGVGGTTRTIMVLVVLVQIVLVQTNLDRPLNNHHPGKRIM